ncbi:MAG: sodium:solute symporter family protein [Planctomycetota bacterium]|nr:sodium:solute symporter family protein [Planctomycetota bacterium]
MPGPDLEARLGPVAAVVLGAYLLVLLGLGVVAWRRSQTSEEDYYLAGRSQGYLVTVMTIMATYFSSAAILGIPGNVYRHGVSFLLFAMNLPVAGACIYLFGARIRRVGARRGYVTQGDMFADYYGDTALLRGLVALVGFLYALPYVIIQIKAGGLLAQSMFPDAQGAFAWGTGLLSLVTLLYVLVGGMRSVAWTDVLQGVLLLAGMLLIAAAMLVSMGGLGAFWREVATLPREALAFPGPEGTWAPTRLMTACLFASLGSLIHPAQWARFYAARSDDTLRRSAVTFATILPACFLLGILLVALGGRALYPPTMVAGVLVPHPDVGAFDQIVIVMTKDLLPSMLGAPGLFLTALILVSVLAAAMSTADSNLHAVSAVATRDIFDRFVDPGASERKRAWVGRGVILATSAVALALVNAGQGNAQFSPLEMIASLMFAAIAFATQLLPATIDMLLVRRGTRAGMLAGMAAGVVTVLLFTPIPAALLGNAAAARALGAATSPLSSLFDLGLLGLAVNVPVFVLVSRLTAPPDPDHVRRFAADLDA